MNLTTYMDESGTHDDSAATVMAGVMANATQWARFEAEFKALKKKYGFRIFHTKKFKRRRGDFKNLDVVKQLALVKDLGALSANSFRDSVTFTLNNVEYEALYKGGDKPRRLRIESRYGLCFRNCVLYFIMEAVKRADEFMAPPKLHFVLESGHRNWSEVRDIFGEMKREIKAVSSYDWLGDITFADKDACDPLMMADFLAHMAWMRASGNLPYPQNEAPYLAASPTPMPEEESGVTSLRIAPGGLADLKKTLIEKLKAGNAFSRRRSQGQSS